MVLCLCGVFGQYHRVVCSYVDHKYQRSAGCNNCCLGNMPGFMKYLKFFFPFLLFLCLSSCISKGEKSKSDESTLILNLRGQNTDSTVYLSEYFSDVTPIVLETAEECLIGNCYSAEFYDGRFFILDAMVAKALFVFNKSGYYIGRFGQIGQGPGEYRSVVDFTIDTEKNEIYLLDSESRKINIYDMESRAYIRSLSLHDDDIYVSDILFNGGKLYANVHYFKGDIPNFPLRKIHPITGEMSKLWKNAEEFNCGWNEFVLKNESFFYCKQQKEAKYTHFFTNTVYSIHEGAIVPCFTLETDDWVSCDEIDRIASEYSNSEVCSVLFGREKAYNIHEYLEWDNYVFFKYEKNGKNIDVIYDKRTEKIKATAHLADNFLFDDLELPVQRKIGSDANGVYMMINTRSIPFFCDLLDNYSVNRKFLRILQHKKIHEESNPILLYYHKKG